MSHDYSFPERPLREDCEPGDRITDDEMPDEAQDADTIRKGHEALERLREDHGLLLNDDDEVVKDFAAVRAALPSAPQGPSLPVQHPHGAPLSGQTCTLCTLMVVRDLLDHIVAAGLLDEADIQYRIARGVDIGQPLHATDDELAAEVVSNLLDATHDSPRASVTTSKGLAAFVLDIEAEDET